MATRRTTTIRILRGLMLTIFLSVLLGVGALWQFGRALAPVQAAGDLPPADEAVTLDEGETARGVGFSQRVLQGDEELFTIRGCQNRADKDENVFLDGCVEIDVARPEGAYRLKSDEGTFNPETREARLEGRVEVEGPDGLTMETDWLELKRGGSLLVASKGSTFRSESGLTGTAQNFRFDLDRQLLVLGGGARIRGVDESPAPSEGETQEEDVAGQEGEAAAAEPPVRYDLSARRIVYDRPKFAIRSEGDVLLRYGTSEVQSMRLQLWLDEVTDSVRRMKALWRVNGVLREQPSPGLDGPAGAEDEVAEAPPEPSTRRVVRFSGHSLELLNDPRLGEPESFTLLGLQVAPAVLLSRSPDERETRSTNAVRIEGDFTNGALTEVTAVGRVRFVEVAFPEGVKQRREVMARRSFAEIDQQGELVRLTLEDDVYMDDSTIQARADRALLDVLQDRTVMDGAPVELKSPQGVLNSPEVRVSGETKLMHATGGVRATLEEGEGGLFSTSPLGAGEGPVRVQAQEALVHTDGSEFMFRNEVRAWRGSNLIVADQLRGNDAEQSMTARGAPLKTVWTPDPGAEAEGPVEITAELLSYWGNEGRMLYEGDVQAEQPGRGIGCQKMDIELSDTGGADVLHCEGDAVLVDRALQRTIKGQRAIYRMVDGEVEVFGDPFTLEDQIEQTTLNGPSLWYRFEDGAYRRVRPETAAEPSGR